MSWYKYVLLFSLFTSGASPSDQLMGSWVRCERGRVYDVEHIVQFGKHNVEYEQISISIGRDRPCAETPILEVYRIWHYEVKNFEFRSTLFTTYVQLSSQDLIKSSISLWNCNSNDWAIGNKIDCSNKPYPRFPQRRGYKTNHTFEVKDNKLFITDEDGEAMVYENIKFDFLSAINHI
jgi:hypothetical protein